MRSSSRPTPARLGAQRASRNSQALWARSRNLALLLILLNGLARNFGPLSDTSSHLIAAFCLAGLGLGSFRAQASLAGWRVGLLGVGTLGFAWWAMQQSHSIPIRLAWVAPLLQGLQWLLLACRSRLKDLRLLLSISLAFTLFQAAAAGLPWLGEMSVALCTGWSRFWSLRLLSHPVDQGPSSLAGGILVSGGIALGCMALSHRRSRRVPVTRMALAFFAMLGTALVFVGVQNQPQLVGTSARAQFLAQGAQLVLLVPCLAWFRHWLAQNGAVSRSSCLRSPFHGAIWGHPARRILCLLGVVLIGLTLAWWPRSAPRTAPVVAFLDAGYVDWKRPEHGRYGAFETGLFGSIHDYLKAANVPSRITRDLSPAALKDVNVLVVINPTNRWAPGQVDAMESFVKRGGGLWVLGDHTDIMGSKAPLDALLEPMGVRFRFDSGFPARPEWRDCLGLMAHPVTHGVRTATDAVISVGASLEVRAPAYTVVWGRYGFSDLGNHLNVQGAFLGDYQYQRGEQLGDVSLVAARTLGQGKVLVFGDTSPLQNAALAYSFHSVVHPSLVWLASKDVSSWIWIRWLVALVGVGMGCVYVRHEPRSGALSLASVALACGLGLGWLLEESCAPPRSLASNVALIDRSHENRISLAPLQPDSIGPVLGTLMRNQLLPGFLSEWSEEEVLRAKVLIIVAPAASYRRAELAVLDRFVREGGLLLFSCGWEERGHSAGTVLDHFGFDILPIPLGPYPVQRVENHLPGQAQFINAWPVTLKDPALSEEFKEARARYQAPLLDPSQSDTLARLLAPLTGGAGSDRDPTAAGAPQSAAQAPGSGVEIPRVKVFCQTQDGHPLIVARRWGQGSVVVIGDSLFLGNDNLENLQYYRKGNLLFLKYLFDHAVWRRR